MNPADVVPMHPEATDSPDTLRWVVRPDLLPPRGHVTEVPGPFGERIARGEAEVRVAANAVVVRLCEPLSWRRDGASLRTELGAALQDPGAWHVEPIAGDEPSGLDARLRTLAQEAIEGRPGDYVRSHGGCVELVGVDSGCVTLRLTGACGHCPASAFTLHRHFEDQLRARCPELVSVDLAHT